LKVAQTRNICSLRNTFFHTLQGVARKTASESSERSSLRQDVSQAAGATQT